MRHARRTSALFPRLTAERADGSPEGHIGFLQLHDTGARIEVGSIDGREFRLVQCLFSPSNFLSARYEPVVQTYERVYRAISMISDTLNARLMSPESAESEMTAIVERSLRKLQGTEAGEHLIFISEGGKLRMSVL